MQLLPTKDEELALRSYLPPMDAPQSEFDGKIVLIVFYLLILIDINMH